MFLTMSATLACLASPLTAYATAANAGDHDAADDALDVLLACGWTVEYLGTSYTLVGPDGSMWTPSPTAPAVASCGPS